MAFRDDHDAALERVRALEQEKAELERKLEDVKAGRSEEASGRERKLAEENVRLERALAAERRRKKREQAGPPPAAPNPSKAASWHRVSKGLSAATGSFLLINVAVSSVAMATEADWSFFAMLGAAGGGFLVGFIGLCAGGAAVKHQTGEKWGESMAGVLFWPLFMAWPVISVLIMLFAVIPLWRGKAAMGDAQIGAVGRPIALTIVFMAFHAQLAHLTLIVAD